MAKKQIDDDEIEDDEIEEEDEILDDEIEDKPKPKTVAPSQRGRPPIATRDKERFKILAQPERIGIIDSDNNEVIVEGGNILPVLVMMLNKLESIDAKIGNI